MIASAIDLDNSFAVSKQPRFFNFDFGSPDEEALIRDAYNRALKKYPNPTTCAQADAYIKAITKELDAMYEGKALATSTGGSGRPQSRDITGTNQRKVELEGIFETYYCATAMQDADNAKFLNTTLESLKATKALTDPTDKTTTYIVAGMLVLVVGATAFFMFRS